MIIPQGFRKKIFRITLQVAVVFSLIRPTAAQEGKGGGSTTPSADQVGATWAIIVGVSEYQSSQIKSLKFADADAMAVADYLKSKSGGSVPRSNIYELYNKEANSSAINKTFNLFNAKITEAPQEIKKNDRIIIYLSGHGGAFNLTDSYFFPYDADNTQDATVSISISILKNYIDTWRKRGMQVILIFDACRSATVTDLGAEGIKLVSQYLEGKRNGEILLVASSKGQEALEFKELEHGLFTYYLLAGLYGMADKDGDNQIKGWEIASYLKENIATHSQNKQFPFIDFNDYENTTFGNVDKAEKALVLAKWSSVNKLDLTSVIASRGGDVVQSAAPSNSNFVKLESSFKEALNKNNLLEPERQSALFYYNELAQTGPQNPKVKEVKLDLAAALLNKAQKVLLEDISGQRGYTRIDPSKPGQNKGGYNPNYYKDAKNALNAYLELAKDANNDIKICLKSYLEARSIIIESAAKSKIESKEMNLKAIAILKNSLTYCDSEPFIHYGILSACSEFDSPLAISECKKIIQLAPSWSYGYNSLALTYDTRKMPDSALFYYLKAEAMNNDDIFPKVNLAASALRQGNFERALGLYFKAYQIDTLQIKSVIGVAESYVGLKKFDQAKWYLMKAKSLDKNDFTVYGSLGFLYQSMQLNDSAYTAFKKSISINPYDDYSYRQLSGLLIDFFNKPDEALNYASKAVALNSANPWNYDMLGYCYQRQGLNTLALENYSQASNREPDNSFLMSRSISIHYLEKKYDLVATTTSKYLEKFPDDWWGLSYMGDASLNLGNLEVAEKNILASIKFNNKYSWTYYLLARVKAAKRDFPAALNSLDQAISLGLDKNMPRNTTEFSELRDTSEYRKFSKRLSLPE